MYFGFQNRTSCNLLSHFCTVQPRETHRMTRHATGSVIATGCIMHAMRWREWYNGRVSDLRSKGPGFHPWAMPASDCMFVNIYHLCIVSYVTVMLVYNLTSFLRHPDKEYLMTNSMLSLTCKTNLNIMDAGLTEIFCSTE